MERITISQRAINTPASAIRKLVPLAEIAKKQGIKVYHVNIGQPDLPTPEDILQKIRSFNLPTLEYAPSNGMEQTIKAWQKFYHNKKIDFKGDDIIVTAGGSEGLIFAFLAVADPGGELLVFEPFYTSYAIVAAMGNIKLKAVRTLVENGFHLPKREIVEGAISNKTRGIVVCNPNNPTGTLYTESEVKMLADIAQKYNLFIISDETYQELTYDNKHILPFATIKNINKQLIIVDSVSKRFNSCGARIGCLVSRNKEVMQAVLRMAQSRLSVATVDQLALIPKLINAKSYIQKITKIYQLRRDIVVSELRKIKGVTVHQPEGAFYIIPKLPIDDSDRFAAFLLSDFSHKGETVMVAPATGFYATVGLGKDEIRIAYVLEEKKLIRAIELLGMAIDQYNKKLN